MSGAAVVYHAWATPDARQRLGNGIWIVTALAVFGIVCGCVGTLIELIGTFASLG